MEPTHPKAFTFTVTLSDDSISGTYDDVTFKNGIASFTLKHGESKTATGLPAGITYSVVESDNSGYTVTATGTEGTIVENETAIAAFTNYKGSSGGGGSDNPTPKDPEEPEEPAEPEEPTTPEEPGTPEEPTVPEEPNTPSEPGTTEKPGLPTELPDPNDPSSPDEITIEENGVPKTYVKVWDPIPGEYVYIPEDEIPLGEAPKTGDTAPTAVFAVLLLAAAGGFAITRRKRSR